MSPFLIFTYGALGLVLAGAALFGWGRRVRRLTGEPPGSWPVSIMLGLAGLIFLGGLLNLCHLAFPWALDLLLLAGLGFAAMEWRATGGRQLMIDSWPVEPKERRQRLVSYFLLVWVMSFMLMTLLPSRLHSPDDDLRKYFAHVARMIQTGTLRGSPLNALGSETLGGQAFLHGFITGHFPIYFIDAVDSIFCLGLCLALAGGMAWRRPALGGAAMVGMAAVVLIHPQSINVSSIYSTAALLMGLILIKIDPRESSTTTPLWRREISAGLISAGVIALKPTGVLFLGLQLFLFMVASAWVTRNGRAALKTACSTVVWTMVFLSPWLMLYGPEQIAGLMHPLPPSSIAIPHISETINLLSSDQRFYGGSYLAYTGVAIGLFIYALANLRASRKELAKRELAFKIAASCAAAVITYLLINIAGLHLVEADGALRYSIPMLIGVAPAVLGLGGLYWNGSWRYGLVFGVALLELFFTATINRIETQYQHHSTIAFLPNLNQKKFTDWKTFENDVLHGPLEKRIEHLQQKIPPGKKIITWVDAPFQLDYKRNTIFDANESGLGASWAALPEADYILWQKEGANVPPRFFYQSQLQHFGRRMGLVMARTLEFQSTLDRLETQSEIVAQEDGFIILRLKPDWRKTAMVDTR